MVSSWLLKVVLGIALAGAIIIELGSPLVAKSQTDDAAHQVADEVSFEVGDDKPPQKELDALCAEEAAKHDVEVLVCKINDDDEIEVRVRKEARSLILKNWSATEDWYYPEVTATAERR